MKKLYVVLMIIGSLLLSGVVYSKGFSGSKSRGSSFSSYKTPSKVVTPKYAAPAHTAPRAATPTPAPIKYGVATSAPNPRASTPTSPQQKVAVVPQVVPKARVQSATTFQQKAAQQQQLATSKVAYQQQQQKMFKPRPVVTSTNTTRVSSFPTNVSRQPKPVFQVKVDRTRYYDRRSSYYSGWDRPQYASRSYSSFGVWDGIALWYMLDHINDSKYRDLYYHQQNDAGMREWRKEADVLAKDNAELRAKLNALDAQVDSQQKLNVIPDPKNIPNDIDPATLLTAETVADTAPELRICSGRSNGSYSSYVSALVTQLDTVKAVNVNTAGSRQNLNMLDSGQCDAAMVQRDTYSHHTSTLPYQRIFSPYNEVLHLVCHKDSGVDELSDLTKKISVDVGEADSGSAVTWNTIVDQNLKFKDVKLQNAGGTVAINNLRNKTVDCAFIVSGTKSQIMSTVIGTSHGDFRLVNWNSNVLQDIKDPANDVVFSKKELADNTYGDIQRDSWMGWFNTDTDVRTVPADLVISNNWKAVNSEFYDNIVHEMSEKSIAVVKSKSL